MKTPVRTSLALAAVAIVLAACGTAEASPQQPTASPVPSETPGATAEPSPSGSPAPVGTLTAADGAVVDGPGVPLADVLAGDLSQPVLVRGTVFLGPDGNVYFADSVVDASVPTFGDTRLIVDNYPNSGPTWDLADAEITGLQEANGVLFFPDTKLYGTISQ